MELAIVPPVAVSIKSNEVSTDPVPRLPDVGLLKLKVKVVALVRYDPPDTVSVQVVVPSPIVVLLLRGPEVATVVPLKTLSSTLLSETFPLTSVIENVYVALEVPTPESATVTPAVGVGFASNPPYPPTTAYSTAARITVIAIIRIVAIIGETALSFLKKIRFINGILLCKYINFS